MSRRLVLALAIAAAVVAVLVGAYLFGRGAGGNAVRATQAKADDRARTEVRVDERTAARATDAIAARASRADRLTDAAVQSTIAEIRNALDHLPADAADPAGDPVAFPRDARVDGVRDLLNAATDRANRAAEPAGAAR